MHIDNIYKDMINLVLNSGELRKNRTGVDTLQVFGHQYKVDLRAGFPILTSKKVLFQSVVDELLWFLRGETNINTLKSPQIWSPWADDNGNCFNIYGTQWVRWESQTDDLEIINRRKPEETDSMYRYVNRENIKEIIKNLVVDDLHNQIFKNKNGLEFKILGKVKNSSSNKNSVYKCQFLETGSIVVASRSNIKFDTVKDPYHNSVYGVACTGNPKLKYSSKSYDMWHSMIARCYNPKNPNYNNYGGRGVTVSHDWLCFENFNRDLPSIPFFQKWIKNPKEYCLDKDYFGSNQYSKSTTIFLDTRYNVSLGNQKYNFSYNNQVYDSPQICGFINKLDPRRISEKILYNKNKKGYENLKIETLPSYQLYRRNRFINQIQNTIDLIKKDPDSRRILVSAWNPADLDKMCLAPCHCLFQLNVSGEFLDLQMYQRSADLLIGVPFNICSYALLLSMLAKECNLIPRYFIHTFGDLHIYTNHIEGAKRQLEREPYELPELVIADKGFWDLKEEDITLKNYKHHPFIKFDVAV